MAKKVVIPRDVDEVNVPDEFPDGFGHSGRRDSLSREQAAYLQDSWARLSDAEKAAAVIALRSHVPQSVVHAPHRMA